MSYRVIEAQSPVFFKEQTVGSPIYSAMACSAADVNGDLIDDLVVLDEGRQLWLGINNGRAKFLWKKMSYHSGKEAVWSINIADLDRNGKNDILLMGGSGNIKILYQYQNQFDLKEIGDSDFFSQGSCVYDFNNDGWLDLTVCDDNAKTKLFENKSGTLNLNNQFMNLSLIPAANEAGNYGVLWTDIDNDQDPDLYLSRCRAGVDDREDMRRRNLLYINENGIFSEQGDAYGLGSKEQSWTTIEADYNGDGLQDLFILNHYTPNQMMIQTKEGKFVDFSLDANIKYAGIPIQAFAVDVDLDSDIDLLITGTTSEMWLNSGNGIFFKSNSFFEGRNFSSACVGDFNSDGAADIYAVYGYLLNTSSNQKDRLFLNTKNNNHYINLQLTGVQSNVHGIGAKVRVYLQQKVLQQFVHCGESFGVQGSLNLNFGLGKHQLADSIVIDWPSGHTDRFEQVVADRLYLIREGSCISNKVELLPTEDILACENSQQEFMLSASPNVHSVEWSNAATDQNTMVSEEAVYFYKALNEKNCPVVSNSILLEQNPKEIAELNYSHSQNLCSGEVLVLKSLYHPILQWNDGSRSDSLVVSQSGVYFATVKGLCNSLITNKVNINIADIEPLNSIPDVTIPYAKSVKLESNQDNTRWYLDSNSLAPIFVGKTFETTILYSDKCYWYDYVQNTKSVRVHTSLSQPEFENSAYAADFLSPTLLFNSYEDFILDSMSLFTDFPGKRRIELFDGNQVKIDSADVNLVQGKNQVYLGFIIEKNKSFILSTNPDINLQELGTQNPKLMRTDKNFSYPIFIEDLAKITGSSVGERYYYFFYDWVVSDPNYPCESELKKVKINIEPNSTKDTDQTCSKWLGSQRIEIPHCEARIRFQLFNSLGQSIYVTDQWDDLENNIINLGTGVYILEMKVGQQSKLIKLIF
ncbi:MAG TPA: FG-GAP-like repeat-containing protein [Saprospiraceae bacterium]|nr:FG-GAP-like repeat-containing protein [Saprospiraceae bacterium]